VSAEYLGHEDGGTTITGSTASGELKVRKADATITAKLDDAKGHQPTRLTAVVEITGAAGDVSPVGTVEVREQGTRIASAVLKAADHGKVTVTLAKLKKKAEIKAVYLGDDNVRKATSDTLTVK
jgi:hypothetical protein